MTYTIERLGLKGDGIAPGPVFAPRTLPGEVVSGTPEKGRIAAPKIVTPSPERVAAPCPQYARCGGCALQHASDAFVASWKVEVVRAALAAQGLEAGFRPLHTSPPRSRRRATLAGRRLKRGTLVGFHARASESLVEIPGCLLLHDDLRELAPQLGVLVALLASRKATLDLAMRRSEVGVDLHVTGAKCLDKGLFEDLAGLAAQLDLARLAVDGEVIVTRRAPVQTFGPATVVPPPGAFVQATADGEAALVEAVREIVGPARRIADLFAGCGTFALPLAETAEVHAVEGDGPMLEALDAGWQSATGLRKVGTEVRDLFRRPLDRNELAGFDAVTIDPPRAGAEAQMAEIAAAQVPRVAMVSCNPVSFARDALILCSSGYKLNWVQVVDQFRWSPHVELAASLTLPHIAP